VFGERYRLDAHTSHIDGCYRPTEQSVVKWSLTDISNGEVMLQSRVAENVIVMTVGLLACRIAPARAAHEARQAEAIRVENLRATANRLNASLQQVASSSGVSLRRQEVGREAYSVSLPYLTEAETEAVVAAIIACRTPEQTEHTA
jgi:hypothetical protein